MIDRLVNILPSSLRKSTKPKKNKILMRSPNEKRNYCLYDLELKENQLQERIAKFKEQREIYLFNKQEFQKKKVKFAERYSQVFGVPTYLLQLSDELNKRESRAIQIISEPIDQIDADIIFVESQENVVNHFETRLNDKIYDLSDLENKMYSEAIELQEILSHNIIKSQENEFIKLKISKLAQEHENSKSESSIMTGSFDDHQHDNELINDLSPPIIKNDSISAQQEKVNDCEKEISNMQIKNGQLKTQNEEILKQKFEKCRKLQNEIQEAEQYQKMIDDKEFEISILNDEYQKTHSKFTQTNLINQKNQTKMVELDQRKKEIEHKDVNLKEKQEKLNELQKTINNCELENEKLYQNYKDAMNEIHLLQKQIDNKLDTIISLSADIHEVPTSPFSKICSNVAELHRKLSNFEKDDLSSESSEGDLNSSV